MCTHVLWCLREYTPLTVNTKLPLVTLLTCKLHGLKIMGTHLTFTHLTFVSSSVGRRRLPSTPQLKLSSGARRVRSETSSSSLVSEPVVSRPVRLLPTPNVLQRAPTVSTPCTAPQPPPVSGSRPSDTGGCTSEGEGHEGNETNRSSDEDHHAV